MPAFTRKKILIILTAVPFLIAFICGMTVSEPPSPESVYEKKRFESSRSYKEKASVVSLQADTRLLDIVSFMKRLHGKPSLEDLNQLFDEAFYSEMSYSHSALSLQWMVVQTWGSIAPKQCLEKLKEMKGGENFLFPLFSGWASKDPEAAMEFYDQKGKNDISWKRFDMLNAITSEYARHSPENAWNWLMSHKGDVSEKEFEDSKYLFFRYFPMEHPELIPEFIKDAGIDEIRNNLYAMGAGWGSYNYESQEWIDFLPKNDRAKARAGRVMGIAQGNLEEISKQLSRIPQEDRMEVIKELGVPVLNAGALDMAERINWLMDSLPESEIPQNVEGTIISWFERNRKDAREWIDSEPLGQKKELLRKWYSKSRHDWTDPLK